MSSQTHYPMEIPSELKDTHKYGHFCQKKSTITAKLSFKRSPDESSIIGTRECYPFEYISPYIKFREDRNTSYVDNCYVETLYVGNTREMEPSSKRSKKDASETSRFMYFSLDTKMSEKIQDMNPKSNSIGGECDDVIRKNFESRANVLSSFKAHFKHRVDNSVHSSGTKIHVSQKENKASIIQADKIFLRPKKHIRTPILKMKLPPARSLMRKSRKRTKFHPSLVQHNVSQVNKFILAKSLVHPFIGIYSFDEVGSLLSALWVARDKYSANNYYTMLINHYIIVGSKKSAPSLISLLESDNDSPTNETAKGTSTSFDDVLKDLVQSKLIDSNANKEEGNQNSQDVPRLQALNLPLEELHGESTITSGILPETFEDVSMNRQL